MTNEEFQTRAKRMNTNFYKRVKAAFPEGCLLPQAIMMERAAAMDSAMEAENIDLLRFVLHIPLPTCDGFVPMPDAKSTAFEGGGILCTRAGRCKGFKGIVPLDWTDRSLFTVVRQSDGRVMRIPAEALSEVDDDRN